MHVLGIVLVAVLLVALGTGGMLLHQGGRELLAEAGADRPAAAAALGLLVLGLVTLPLGLGYGLRGGIVGVVFACTPSLGFAVIGGVLLHGDPTGRDRDGGRGARGGRRSGGRDDRREPPASARLGELFPDQPR